MIPFVFVKEKHEEYGSYGWRMKDKPHFEPFQGMAVAHDCLEHFSDDDGSIGHELMALGASLLVRNMEMYYFYKGRSKTNPADSIASEYVTLYSLKLQDVSYYKAEEKYYKPLKDNDLEACVQLIRRKAINDVCDNNDVSRSVAEPFVKMSLPWLRKGILMAQEKYKEWPSIALLEAFMKIEKEADEALKDEEYTELHVRINMNTCMVNVEPVCAWDLEESA